MSDSTLVLYHDSCADGFGAAFAAHCALGDSAIYVPVQYGKPYPPEIDGGVSAVYILDFSYPRATLGRIAAAAGKVVVQDHHKTARADLEGWDHGNPRMSINFDMSKSGAVLAWEYFHPDKPVPMLLQYVQDRDLWEWKLPGSREFSAALAVEPREFKLWTYFRQGAEQEKWREDFMRHGRTILKAQAVQVNTLADHATLRDVGGHRVPAVNAPLLQSEIGEELCKRHPDAPFSATFFIDGEGDEVWSLRSRGGFDVSAVAKQLGGGGHQAAAGFTVKH